MQLASDAEDRGAASAEWRAEEIRMLSDGVAQGGAAVGELAPDFCLAS
jgi:hypothetical protein